MASAFQLLDFEIADALLMAMSTPPSLLVRWHDRRTIGRVVVPGATEFGYEPVWLEDGYNLSPLRVPFGPNLYRLNDRHFDFLPGFLSDCLPDQWGRRIMAQEFAQAGIKPTPMKMLAWVGGRGIGALRFEPAVLDGATSSTWEPVRPLLLAREAQAVLRQQAPEAYATLRKAGTAGGAFPKATVALLPDGSLLCGGDVAQAMPTSGARLGILKLDIEDDPTRPTTDGRLECAYMKMARAAGIRTADCEILADHDDERPRHHLFVDRFDVDAGSPHRLHTLTLAGVTETHNLTYRHLLDAARRLTEDRREMTEVVRRMVFNVRAANADDHGKNHSFLYDDRLRRWILSPAYDLTLNFSTERSYSGLFPNTFGDRPRLSALKDVAADVGVTEDEFNVIDAEVCAALARWPEFAQAEQLPAADLQRAQKLHSQMADSLSFSSPPPRRTKRRVVW
jgi:serine/threonine-protein kinase HipA